MSENSQATDGINRQLARVEIFGLFGRFDHLVALSEHEGISILHGPNGVGKTTILSMIYNIFNKKFNYVLDVPFEEFRVKLVGVRAQLIVRKKGRKLVFNHSSSQHTWPTRSEFNSKYFHPNLIERYVPHLRRVGGYRWRDRAVHDDLSLDEVFARYSDELPAHVRDRIQPKLPDWLEGFLDSLVVRFIETQRLFTTSRKKYEDRVLESTVLKYSEKMADLVKENLRKSGVLAAKLDRTFPHRLLSKVNISETEKEIRARYSNQELYRQRLMNAGLLEEEDPISLSEEKLDKNSIRVLHHYLQDVDEKFRQFEDVLARVELLKDIINTRFLYKSFGIDKDKGFVFTTDSGNEIKCGDLSSGEQHELVLAFQLIFLFKSGSLVLIDEPEISLHVTWQRKFLKDLSRITVLNGLSFLVATHSPQIINDRTDLMIPLGGGEGG